MRELREKVAVWYLRALFLAVFALVVLAYLNLQTLRRLEAKQNRKAIEMPSIYQSANLGEKSYF